VVGGQEGSRPPGRVEATRDLVEEARGAMWIVTKGRGRDKRKREATFARIFSARGAPPARPARPARPERTNVAALE
jgi:hypothetical protein